MVSWSHGLMVSWSHGLLSWSPLMALEESFQLSKEAIILAIHQVKIVGDRTLDEITNSRLFRLKQRPLQVGASTSPYLPVKSNHGADVTSRHPSPSGSANTTPLERPASLIKWSRHSCMASILSDTQKLGTISWSLIAQETAADTSLSHLLKLTEQGDPGLGRRKPSLPPVWPICESLYAQEGVLLYQDRVV